MHAASSAQPTLNVVLPAWKAGKGASERRCATPEDVLALLANQRRFERFYPVLSAKLGSFKAALFLGHALYWARHLLTQPERDGWCFMTATQCQAITGLSVREQASARRLLCGLGILQEKLAGVPATLHYRINFPALLQWAGVACAAADDAAAALDALKLWLDESIPYYKPLADCEASVAGGLYLSLLLQRQRNWRDADGYSRVPQKKIAELLGFGSKTQRNTREKLKACGLLKERAWGGAFVRVDTQALMGHIVPDWKAGSEQEGSSPIEESAVMPQRNIPTFLNGLSHKNNAPQTHLHPDSAMAPQAQDAPLSTVRRWLHSPPAPGAIHIAAAAQAALALPSRWDSPSAALPKKPIGTGRVRRMFEIPAVFLPPPAVSERDKRRAALGRRLKRAQQKAAQQAAARAAPPVSTKRQKPALKAVSCQHSPPSSLAQEANCLVMPEKLDGALHNAAQRTVSGASIPVFEQQMLLDELAGQLATKHIANPIGYLYALLQKHLRGELQPALAAKVAVDRARKKECEKILHKAMNPGTSSSAAKDGAAIIRNEQRTVTSEKWRGKLAQLRKKLRSAEIVARRGKVA